MLLFVPWISGPLTRTFISMKIILMKKADSVSVQLSHAPPIRRVPLALARRFFQICNTVGAEAVAEADLTPLEFAAMAYVNSTDGEPGIDQRGLAERVGVDRNTTSLLVRSLEAKGLLEQRVSETDRRARLIRLTPQGETLFRKLHPDALAAQKQILAFLEPAERELLLDVLVRVIDEYRHLARPGAGRRKRNSKTRAITNGRRA
jgi:DNA-binding MarR family transcriptional regulator